MSQEDVEVVRWISEAFQRRDREEIERSFDALDPEFEWDTSGYPAVGVASEGRGRANFRRFLERYRATEC